jgi:hypothetical protein
LHDDGTVSRAGESVGTGKWTMVYDEGFEVQFKGVKYFAFSKYKPDGSNA